MTLSANVVADYFIRFSHEHGDYITNLKLQKLVYYAQAWYLALHKKPLYQEPIEAWIHGPVIPGLYQRFKDFRYEPITTHPTSPKLPDSICNHLDEIMNVYGGYAAFELEHLTHQADPWKNARHGLPIDAPSNEIITHEDMRIYYTKMAKENANQGQTTC